MDIVENKVEASYIKKNETRRAFRDLITLRLESQSVSAASKTFTVPQWFVSDKLLTSGVSNSQDTTKLQQRAHNTKQSLSQLCIPSTNLSNIRAHIYVAKAT